RRGQHLDDFAGKARDFFGTDRAKARHCGWVIEVPSVLHQPDEILDCWIGGPGASKCRTGQLRRDVAAQEGGDVGVGADRVERWQLRRIEWLIFLRVAVFLRLSKCTVLDRAALIARLV